ncbi:MAG: IS481 family transposase [Candidatus Thiodiazotropha sp. (ex. Lucinisca nassula)]|nr:IS481 family transposase [Candidatus Thiodiazotropha sp. (ex. Lucinisca nassula)]MBW9275284.1 IS481 family transposase [Candidatus Thiodiazotropha sp. (ex. Lucinisca nassula)]PUB81157.1 MAG: IS481 family transposase [gamma proteobacterium symbiont of Ctena orbiculata]
MNQSTQRIIGNKLGLLNLAEELGNVSKACQMMGVSRDTFYRYKSARDEGGVTALLDKSRRKPNPKNRVEPQIEQAVLNFALEYPAHGQVRVSNELRKKGVFVSPSGVRSIWLRHQLQSRKLRLRALEAKVAKEGLVLTEAQVIALERQQTLNEAYGEIETEHPGYLGSQDTYYVGTIKGIGRIYQQTFVDTYSKVAACKLYTTKTPITAADLLNDRVLPMLESEDVDLLRILTDRGTEFCGRPERHDYQLFLAINDIDHTRSKAYSPQTNGIYERFHRTVKEEFYEITFRKKVYAELEELQNDLDAWVDLYNNERTHQGKMCCGRTPMQTLRDGRKLWDEKVGNLN